MKIIPIKTGFYILLITIPSVANCQYNFKQQKSRTIYNTRIEHADTVLVNVNEIPDDDNISFVTDQNLGLFVSPIKGQWNGVFFCFSCSKNLYDSAMEISAHHINVGTDSADIYWVEFPRYYSYNDRGFRSEGKRRSTITYNNKKYYTYIIEVNFTITSSQPFLITKMLLNTKPEVIFVGDLSNIDRTYILDLKNGFYSRTTRIQK